MKKFHLFILERWSDPLGVGLVIQMRGNQHGLLVVQEDTTPSKRPESRKILADLLMHEI
jgi:hypothetical protein